MRNLVCPKCGSLKFKPLNPLMGRALGAMSIDWENREVTRRTCADCGYEVKVTKMAPESEHVFIGANDKVE